MPRGLFPEWLEIDGDFIACPRAVHQQVDVATLGTDAVDGGLQLPLIGAIKRAGDNHHAR